MADRGCWSLLVIAYGACGCLRGCKRCTWLLPVPLFCMTNRSFMAASLRRPQKSLAPVAARTVPGSRCLWRLWLPARLQAVHVATTGAVVLYDTPILHGSQPTTSRAVDGACAHRARKSSAGNCSKRALMLVNIRSLAVPWLAPASIKRLQKKRRGARISEGAARC